MSQILQFVNLRGKNLSKVPLLQIYNIENLDLSNNKLCDSEGLAQLLQSKQLQNLKLISSNILEICYFDVTLSQIRSLNVLFNEIGVETQKLICNLPKLEELQIDSLCHCFFPSNASIQNIVIYDEQCDELTTAKLLNLPNLRSINMKTNAEHLNGFDPMKCNIQKLELWGSNLAVEAIEKLLIATFIDDIRLIRIMKLPQLSNKKLKMIKISQTFMLQTEMPEIRSIFSLPQIETIEIWEKMPDISQIFLSPTIKCVTLENAQLTQQSLDAILQLPQLESLKIEERTTSPVYDGKKLSKLKNLFIRQVRAEISDISLLFASPSLSQLCIPGRYQKIDDISTLTPILTTIDVSDNLISADVANVICAQINLTNLNLSSCGLLTCPAFHIDSMIVKMSLSLNKIDDEQLINVFKLKRLEKLELNACRLQKLPLISSDDHWIRASKIQEMGINANAFKNARDLQLIFCLPQLRSITSDFGYTSSVSNFQLRLSISDLLKESITFIRHEYSDYFSEIMVIERQEQIEQEYQQLRKNMLIYYVRSEPQKLLVQNNNRKMQMQLQSSKQELQFCANIVLNAIEM